MHRFDWGQFIASAVSVLVLLGAAAWWLKRQRGLSGMPTPTQCRIQVIDSLTLSFKHRMVLIQVDHQRVLATVSPGEVKTLHAWSDGVGHDD